MDDIYKAAVIIIQDRRLLFTRATGMDFFIEPGGKIERGETAKQALVRELKEELSIDVDEADLEPFGEYTDRHSSRLNFRRSSSAKAQRARAGRLMDGFDKGCLDLAIKTQEKHSGPVITP